VKLAPRQGGLRAIAEMFITRDPQPMRAPVEGHPVSATFASTSGRENDMHPKDLMKPDLFSEILLLGVGGVMFAALLLVVVITLARS